MPVTTIPESIKSVEPGKPSDFFRRQRAVFPTITKPGRQVCKLCYISPNSDSLIWSLHTGGASLRSIVKALSPSYPGITIYPQNIQRHLVHLEKTISAARRIEN